MRNVKPTARAVLIDSHDEVSEKDVDALERRFFNQLVLSNGTLKTTYTNRLPDVESACNSLLEKCQPVVRILDMGVSSGVTTHEWIQSLGQAQIEFKMDAFDLCMDASILSFSENFHILVDSAHRPLQFEVFGRAESNNLGKTLSRKIRRGIPVVALRIAFAISKLLPGVRARSTAVKLVSHKLESAENVRVFEHDLSKIDELPGQYDMIRAANILNRAYFDSAFLADAISKVKGKLSTNGFFCVVRTDSDGTNNGTIYQLTHNTLHPVIQIGDGTEIDELIS